MKKLICAMVLAMAARAGAVDIWMDVDAALAEVPVNKVPLVDATDGVTIENAIAFDAAGMALFWNFVTTAGAMTSTAVTPTEAGTGVYDWTDQGDGGLYSIEIPASGGGTINNDTEGYGWFTGKCTATAPWSGPVIGFRDANLNNALVDGAMTQDAVPAVLANGAHGGAAATLTLSDYTSFVAATAGEGPVISVANGATNVSIYFFLRDQRTGQPYLTTVIADCEMYYLEDGGTRSANIFTGACDAGTDPHEDGEAFDMGGGLIRTDWPDAAFDGGVGKRVKLQLKPGDGYALTETITVILSPPANATHVGGTAQTAADLGAMAVILDAMIDAANRWVSDAFLNLNGGRY